MTIPAGAGNSKRQLKLVKDFGTTVAHILLPTPCISARP